MNDGYLQHMRVGACAGLGTKYLARKIRRVSHDRLRRMARSYAEAIKHVRPIEVMRVFSRPGKPRNVRRGDDGKVGSRSDRVDSPEKALKGADIVSLTTDSLVR